MADASPSSPKILYPGWQHEFRAALLELDTEKLRERVAAAETAIFNRLRAISHSSDTHAERQAIQDALEVRIHAAMWTFGPVNRVSIMTDRETGEPRGFGFVEMASAADAD